MIPPANCALLAWRTLTILCPSLREERMEMIAKAPHAVRAHLPDPDTRPEEFTNVILGTDWIDVHEVQASNIYVNSNLKQALKRQLSHSKKKGWPVTSHANALLCWYMVLMEIHAGGNQEGTRNNCRIDLEWPIHPWYYRPSPDDHYPLFPTRRKGSQF